MDGLALSNQGLFIMLIESSNLLPVRYLKLDSKVLISKRMGKLYNKTKETDNAWICRGLLTHLHTPGKAENQMSTV